MKADKNNTAVAGATGAVIAGVAVAAAAILADKKKRTAIKNTVSDIKDHVIDTMKNSGNSVEESIDSLKNKVEKEQAEKQKPVKK